ncbi:MAG: DUF1501 domain-containing protein [Verrucomicrobiota bacterium]
MKKFSSSTGRRDFLYQLGTGLGSIALTDLLAGTGLATGKQHNALPSPGSFIAKAKSCIFLMMEGGPSHIDTFDPKPKLQQLHAKEFVRDDKMLSAMASGKRYYVQSPFDFIKAGQSGADMCSLWENLATVADDLCFYRGCQVDSVNHPTAMYQMNSGSRFSGDPAMGSWITYGLGSQNQNLPGFIVLPESNHPQGGPSNWGNGFLPASFQGTPLRPKGMPILDLKPPAGITRDHQQHNLKLLSQLNLNHAKSHPQHEELKARMASYELAFRMQMEVPGILDIEGEDQSTKDLYGIGQSHSDEVGRKCLLARRLVERGVRFVQLYAGNWDSHNFIKKSHGKLIRSVDQPIAALVKDLKNRGMLDETLIVWCGEFGRTPDNGLRGGGTSYGRDHNPKAMTVWMAGGGVKAGHTIGATDETGSEAVDTVHHVRDLHVTLLKLMGLDDNKLTFYHGGRYKQLSQFGGLPINELIA